jgi:hypothetical protein
MPMRTHRIVVAALFLAAIVCAAANDPSAPGFPARDNAAEYDWGIRGGIGFTADPEAFLMGLEAEYSLTRDLRIGPLLQIATEDETTIVAPTANLKFLVPMPENAKGLARLHPFFQGGLGFAYVEKERDGRHDEDDVGFLVNAGFGCDYMLTDRFGVGSNLLFNVLPAETAGERFFFSWQVVTFTVRF